MLQYFQHHSLIEEFANSQKASLSFAMSVRPSVCNNSSPTGRVYMKSDISIFFKNLSRILKFHSNLTGTIDTLHEDLNTIVTVCGWILSRMRNVSDRFAEKTKTRLCLVTFPENCAVYEINWENTGSSKKMDGIWSRYNLKSTGRIYTFGVLKCSEKFKVLDLP